MNRSASSSVRLSDVVARLRAEDLVISAPAADPLLTGVSDDSRRVGVGDLFCAWAGTSTDAHDFVPAGAAAGAVAVLVERPLTTVALPQVVVRDGRRAAAVAAMVVLGDPAAHLRLIGVTGTNGKSTTVWMLRHVLSARFATASIGTLGVRRADGSLVPGSENLTTPGPVELARLLRELADEGAAAVAMEVSSHALDQGRVAALRFDAVVFTNLTRDHLDYHGTLEAYREVKLRLLDRLAPDGLAVYNAADPAWQGVAARAPRALGFRRAGPQEEAGAEVRAQELRMSPAGADFRLVAPEGSARTLLPLVGEYNVDNALGAAAVALGLGVPLAALAGRLATLPQVPGRLEKLTEDPCPVFADYAHTPDALERALAALRPLATGRLIVLFGAGGDRDQGKRPLMAAAAQRQADRVVVTSDNPRTEQPDAIIDQIVAGFTRGGWTRITDRRQAIGRVLDEARPGDVVLLAGKGHETYQIVGREKRHLDEREVVAAWLAARGRPVVPAVERQGGSA